MNIYSTGCFFEIDMLQMISKCHSFLENLFTRVVLLKICFYSSKGFICTITKKNIQHFQAIVMIKKFY